MAAKSGGEPVVLPRDNVKGWTSVGAADHRRRVIDVNLTEIARILEDDTQSTEPHVASTAAQRRSINQLYNASYGGNSEAMRTLLASTRHSNLVVCSASCDAVFRLVSSGRIAYESCCTELVSSAASQSDVCVTEVLSTLAQLVILRSVAQGRTTTAVAAAAAAAAEAEAESTAITNSGKVNLGSTAISGSENLKSFHTDPNKECDNNNPLVAVMRARPSIMPEVLSILEQAVLSPHYTVYRDQQQQQQQQHITAVLKTAVVPVLRAALRSTVEPVSRMCACSVACRMLTYWYTSSRRSNSTTATNASGILLPILLRGLSDTLITPSSSSSSMHSSYSTKSDGVGVGGSGVGSSSAHASLMGRTILSAVQNFPRWRGDLLSYALAHANRFAGMRSVAAQLDIAAHLIALQPSLLRSRCLTGVLGRILLRALPTDRVHTVKMIAKYAKSLTVAEAALLLFPAVLNAADHDEPMVALAAKGLVSKLEENLAAVANAVGSGGNGGNGGGGGGGGVRSSSGREEGGNETFHSIVEGNENAKDTNTALTCSGEAKLGDGIFLPLFQIYNTCEWLATGASKAEVRAWLEARRTRLFCSSNRSDGTKPPSNVIAANCDAELLLATACMSLPCRFAEEKDNNGRQILRQAGAQILLSLVKHRPSVFAHQAFTFCLYCTRAEHNARTHLLLLQTMADCSMDSRSAAACATLVAEHMARDPSLLPLSIALLARLLRAYPRAYSHFQRLVVERKGEWTRTETLARAAALHSACSHSTTATTHGVDMIPAIAEVLMQKNLKHSVAVHAPVDDRAPYEDCAALAMDAAYQLAAAGVVSAVSVWRALGPHLGGDAHPNVLRVVCRLFGKFVSKEDRRPLAVEPLVDYTLAPAAPRARALAFLRNALSHSDVRVQRSAASALACFHPDCIWLAPVSPTSASVGHYDASASKSDQQSPAGGDSYAAAPGSFYTNLLTHHDAGVVSCAKHLLSRAITNELGRMGPQGIREANRRGRSAASSVGAHSTGVRTATTKAGAATREEGERGGDRGGAKWPAALMKSVRGQHEDASMALDRAGPAVCLLHSYTLAQAGQASLIRDLLGDTPMASTNWLLAERIPSAWIQLLTRHAMFVEDQTPSLTADEVRSRLLRITDSSLATGGENENPVARANGLYARVAVATMPLAQNHRGRTKRTREMIKHLLDIVAPAPDDKKEEVKKKQSEERDSAAAAAAAATTITLTTSADGSAKRVAPTGHRVAAAFALVQMICFASEDCVRVSSHATMQRLVRQMEVSMQCNPDLACACALAYAHTEYAAATAPLTAATVLTTDAKTREEVEDSQGVDFGDAGLRRESALKMLSKCLENHKSWCPWEPACTLARSVGILLAATAVARVAAPAETSALKASPVQIHWRTLSDLGARGEPLALLALATAVTGPSAASVTATAAAQSSIIATAIGTDAVPALMAAAQAASGHSTALAAARALLCFVTVRQGVGGLGGGGGGGEGGKAETVANARMRAADLVAGITAHLDSTASSEHHLYALTMLACAPPSVRSSLPAASRKYLRRYMASSHSGVAAMAGLALGALALEASGVVSVLPSSAALTTTTAEGAIVESHCGGVSSGAPADWSHLPDGSVLRAALEYLKIGSRTTGSNDIRRRSESRGGGGDILAILSVLSSVPVLPTVAWEAILPPLVSRYAECGDVAAAAAKLAVHHATTCSGAAQYLSYLCGTTTHGGRSDNDSVGVLLHKDMSKTAFACAIARLCAILPRLDVVLAHLPSDDAAATFVLQTVTALPSGAPPSLWMAASQGLLVAAEVAMGQKKQKQRPRQGGQDQDQDAAALAAAAPTMSGDSGKALLYESLQSAVTALAATVCAHPEAVTSATDLVSITCNLASTMVAVFPPDDILPTLQQQLQPTGAAVLLAVQLVIGGQHGFAAATLVEPLALVWLSSTPAPSAAADAAASVIIAALQCVLSSADAKARNRVLESLVAAMCNQATSVGFRNAKIIIGRLCLLLSGADALVGGGGGGGGGNYDSGDDKSCSTHMGARTALQWMPHTLVSSFTHAESGGTRAFLKKRMERVAFGTSLPGVAIAEARAFAVEMVELLS